MDYKTPTHLSGYWLLVLQLLDIESIAKFHTTDCL